MQEVTDKLNLEDNATSPPVPTQNEGLQNKVESYYTTSIPAEPGGRSSGRLEGVLSIIFAVISLLFFPPIFGAAGIFLGLQAKKKGQLSLGTTGIILSAIFMILGIILGILVYTDIIKNFNFNRY